jgi:hypothetical protein
MNVSVVASTTPPQQLRATEAAGNRGHGLSITSLCLITWSTPDDTSAGVAPNGSAACAVLLIYRWLQNYAILLYALQYII